MSGELFDAIDRGDVAEVEKCLAGGADPNAEEAGELGWLPLHAVIEAIDAEGAPVAVLRVLLDHGARVDGWDRDWEATPLLMAVFRSLPECVRLLLARGANPDVVGIEGDTPILCSLIQEDHEITDMLLTHGIGESINRPGTIEGTTPLGAAARLGRIDFVERILAAGADLDVTDYDRFTAEERAQRALAKATGELAERLELIVERLQRARCEARCHTVDETP